MLYQLLNGTHSEAGVEYTFKPGQAVVVPSKHQLDKMFPDRFRKIDAHVPQAQAPVTPEVEWSAEVPTIPVVGTPQPGDFVLDPVESATHSFEGSTKPPEPTTAGDPGTEVTNHYPTASEHGLRVFRRKSRLYLTTSDPAELAGAAGGYVSTKQIEKAIDKWTETHVST
jgi:hypothetical protein